MRTLIVVALLVGCLTLAFSMAFAGNNPNAKAAVHVRAHNAKASCNPGFDPLTATCANLVTTLAVDAGSSVDAFPVLYSMTEYTGCEFGMTWPTWTYSVQFTSCSDFVIAEIVNPGGGASHAWISCKTGVCVPCFLWMYAEYQDDPCGSTATESVTWGQIKGMFE
jgi:hypothetical protein